MVTETSADPSVDTGDASTRRATMPLWRVRLTILLGVGFVGLGAFLGLTLRPAWSWAPAWLLGAAPFAAAIGCMIVGLVALGEVWQWAQRLWRTVAGSLLIVAGLAMLVLPGPGLFTIGAGLWVLSREYTWADEHYARVARQVQAAKDKARDRLATRREERSHLPPARTESVVTNLRLFENDRAADERPRDRRECA